MRKLLAAGLTILVCVLCFDAGTASAKVSVEVDIKNKSCDRDDDDVHARVGDQVCAKLKVKNESKHDAVMQIRIVGGIPSCMVDTTVTMEFDGKETKRHELCEIVPDGLDGEILIIVVEARSPDGDVADDCARLNFGVRSDNGDDDDDDDDDDGDSHGGNGGSNGDDGENDSADGAGDAGSSGSIGPQGGMFRQIFVRVLSRSLVSGLVRDHGAATAEATFSEFKQLYR